MNESHVDLYVTGPADKKKEALLALRALGYEEKSERTPSPSWRDAFPSEIRENDGGVVLKVTRERKGLSQTALSEMTRIPQPHISEMERGKRPIGKKTAHQLGRTLDVDYRVFL